MTNPRNKKTTAPADLGKDYGIDVIEGDTLVKKETPHLEMEVEVNGAEEALEALKNVSVKVRAKKTFSPLEIKAAHEFLDSLGDRIDEILAIKIRFIWEHEQSEQLKEQLHNDFMALINSNVFADVHVDSTPEEKTNFINYVIQVTSPHFKPEASE